MRKLLILALLGTAACSGGQAPAENIVPNAIISGENDVEPTPVVPAGNVSDEAGGGDFISPKLPTPVLQIECRQGECYWDQITAIEDVRKGKGETLKKVTSKSGTSYYSLEKLDPPSEYSKSVKVEWEPEPRVGYVLCSKTRPTDVTWDKDEKQFLVTTLSVADPGGYQVSAVNLYLQICHDIAPGKADAAAIAKLGYGSTSGDQVRMPTLDDVMKALN